MRHLLVHSGLLLRNRGLHSPKLKPQRDDPLLCPVVEIPLESAPGLIGGRDDARARRGDLRLRLGVEYRGTHQIGEIPYPGRGLG